MRENLATFKEEIRQDLPGTRPFLYSKDLSPGEASASQASLPAPGALPQAPVESPWDDPQDSRLCCPEGPGRPSSATPTVAWGLCAETVPRTAAPSTPPLLGRHFMDAHTGTMGIFSALCASKPGELKEGAGRCPPLSPSLWLHQQEGTPLWVCHGHTTALLSRRKLLAHPLVCRAGLLLIGTGADSFVLPSSFISTRLSNFPASSREPRHMASCSGGW